MGCDVAAIFVASGWTVQVVEPDAGARATLARRIGDAAAQISSCPPAASPGVLALREDILWDDVRIVIECVPEDLAIKREVFAWLDRNAPVTVPLTSNSSSLPIGRIGEGLTGQARMLGLHFFMPAHLVPAVEVVRSVRSSEAVAQKVSAIMREVRKRPVQVKRDVPGFLANRIQHALMREAIALVEEGFASPEDVDLAVRYGFGFRYIAAGPLLQKDLAGIDIHCAAAATMYPHLNRATEPSKLMRELVADGSYGVKSPNRRGFYAWDDASIAREQQRYQRALLKAMEILRDEEHSES